MFPTNKDGVSKKLDFSAMLSTLTFIYFHFN